MPAILAAMADHIQVFTTTGSEQEAERIAAALVERRLAACVQVIGPIASRYRWQGEVEAAREWLCLAKTEAVALPASSRRRSASSTPTTSRR